MVDSYKHCTETWFPQNEDSVFTSSDIVGFLGRTMAQRVTWLNEMILRFKIFTAVTMKNGVF
jgi:hypothetical protein